MKTVKEYANSVGKSHQSVYKQLNSKKNKERLENHVWKQDGTTYLDDVAIDILNESRQMIQIQNDIQTHEENDNLRKEVNDLKNKIINLQDDFMAKTIKQIADELGISKQAVFKRIDNLGLRSKLTKIDNQLMVEKEQENMIKSAFSEKQPSTKPSTKPSTSLQLETVNDEVVDVLLNQSEMLKNELKIKNKQIEELNKRLEENQKLLDQQQKLHAMAEQKIHAVLQTAFLFLDISLLTKVTPYEF